MSIPGIGGSYATHNTPGLGATGQSLPGNNAMQDFMNYMKMTPAEKMQYVWLAMHGISKEEFDAMSDVDKQKLLEQMKREIEEKIKEAANNPKEAGMDIFV